MYRMFDVMYLLESVMSYTKCVMKCTTVRSRFNNYNMHNIIGTVSVNGKLKLAACLSHVA